MPRSDALVKAQKKYRIEKCDEFLLRLPKGMKQEIKDFAENNETSLNAFICEAIEKAMNEKNNSF